MIHPGRDQSRQNECKPPTIPAQLAELFRGIAQDLQMKSIYLFERANFDNRGSHAGSDPAAGCYPGDTIRQCSDR
jgi:hypothetical protein